MRQRSAGSVVFDLGKFRESRIANHAKRSIMRYTRRWSASLYIAGPTLLWPAISQPASCVPTDAGFFIRLHCSPPQPDRAGRCRRSATYTSAAWRDLNNQHRRHLSLRTRWRRTGCPLSRSSLSSPRLQPSSRLHSPAPRLEGMSCLLLFHNQPVKRIPKSVNTVSCFRPFQSAAGDHARKSCRFPYAVILERQLQRMPGVGTERLPWKADCSLCPSPRPWSRLRSGIVMCSAPSSLALNADSFKGSRDGGGKHRIFRLPGYGDFASDFSSRRALVPRQVEPTSTRILSCQDAPISSRPLIDGFQRTDQLRTLLSTPASPRLVMTAPPDRYGAYAAAPADRPPAMHRG